MKRGTLPFSRLIFTSSVSLIVLCSLLGNRLIAQPTPTCVNIVMSDYVLDLNSWSLSQTSIGTAGEVIPSPDNAAQAIVLQNYPYLSGLALKNAHGVRRLERFAGHAVWSHAGNHLFYIATDQNNRAFTLIEVDQQGDLVRKRPLTIPPWSGIELLISADDQFLALVPADQPVQIYRRADFHSVAQLPPTSFPHNVIWSPVGHSAIVLQDNHIFAWSPEGGTLLDLPGLTQMLRWSPDAQSVALLTKISADDSEPRYNLGVYRFDGTLARSLFDTGRARLSFSSTPAPRVLWFDSHTLALWRPLADGRYALARYDVAVDQYQAQIDDASEPGIFLSDQQHVVYRVANGDHFSLRLASIADGSTITLADSFGSLTSYYTLRASPDSTGFSVELSSENESETHAVIWSRNDGSAFGSLSAASYNWFGASTLAYLGPDAQGKYAGLVNLAADTDTRVLDSMAQITFIPVDQAKQEPSGYLAFHWQSDSAAGFDIYAPDGTRLHRLPSDFSANYMNGPFLNPVLFLSPDGRLVIPRGDYGDTRLQVFADDQLIADEPMGWLEDVLWFPDSSGALLMTYNQADSQIWQVNRAGEVERTLTTPYLSRGSHINYWLDWCLTENDIP